MLKRSFYPDPTFARGREIARKELPGRLDWDLMMLAEAK
jgi:hypothetical protein